MISATKSSGCIPQLTLVMGVVIVAVMAFQSPNKSTSIKGGIKAEGIRWTPDYSLTYLKDKYSVSYTQAEWQAELDTLRMFQNVVGYQLSRQEADQWQIIILRMQQRFVAQLQPQIMAELKKDSTKNK